MIGLNSKQWIHNYNLSITIQVARPKNMKLYMNTNALL